MTGTFPLDKSLFSKEDMKDLGTEMFTNVSAPVDWCTARQAQLMIDNAVPHDSVLHDIATGRIQTPTCSPEEARQLSQYLDTQYQNRRERR